MNISKLFRKKAPTIKVRATKIVEVTDLFVTIDLPDAFYTKEFRGCAYYDPCCHSGCYDEDGVVVSSRADLEQDIRIFIERWKDSGIEIFDNDVVRYDRVLRATIDTKRRSVRVDYEKDA